MTDRAEIEKIAKKVVEQSISKSSLIGWITNALTAKQERVEEAEGLYIQMMNLRDDEIRKVGKLEAEKEALEKRVMEMEDNRCDCCGARLNLNGCLICGAPVCCPPCCKYTTAEYKIQSLETLVAKQRKALMEIQRFPLENPKIHWDYGTIKAIVDKALLITPSLVADRIRELESIVHPQEIQKHILCQKEITTLRTHAEQMAGAIEEDNNDWAKSAVDAYRQAFPEKEGKQ